jgi:hypothetical protein
MGWGRSGGKGEEEKMEEEESEEAKIARGFDMRHVKLHEPHISPTHGSEKLFASAPRKLIITSHPALPAGDVGAAHFTTQKQYHN